MKIREIATAIGLEFFGNGELEVEGVRDTAFPTPISKSHIYFIGSTQVFESTPNIDKIAIVLTVEKFRESFPNGILAPEGEGKLALTRLLKLFDRVPNFGSGISPRASISPSAKIGQNVTILDFAVVMDNATIEDNCSIHPHTVIEPGAYIGENTTIRANVVIGYNCVIGKNCIIHSNTTIGADGFGFIDTKGQRHKVPQIGNVVIGDHVEIGASSTVDRAAIESTTIGDYTKIDDQVHIGHNCRVGRYVYLAGTAGLAGGVVLEDYVMVGGQAAIAEHLTVKKGSIIMGLTGVTKDTEEKGMYFGIPARPAMEMFRISSALSELPGLIKKVKKLENRLSQET